MSGRVAAVDAVASDPRVIWVGSATGGVWKSTSGGLVFEPVFDNEAASSIGAVAIHQRNPDVVWVGTGEANPRNSMGTGRGVWRTIDGGESWTFLGLGASERISRIAVHPDDADVAWVAALGPAWSDGEERGVFRTRDGGETWEKVLYVDERTGAADLVMDPSNPDRLIAAMWEYRRWPWTFRSGGPGSGLYITHDGGDTWTELTSENGLPAGDLGRIGLAYAPGSPDVAYALVEATRSELLRSDDGGLTWRMISRERGVNPRPFYYADIEVDPVNENRLYRIAGSLEVSEDGGRTFRTVVSSSKIHGDIHAVWLDPRDGQLLIQGNDGGIGISPDRGATWRFVSNLPLGQYYHIAVDADTPYNVYGGMQDNGSWVGPSSVRHSGGIRNYDYQRVGGGDGFAVIPDPVDRNAVYGLSQGGSLFHLDRITGARRSIQPVHPDGVPLRFSWNAALASDPHDAGTIYLGSQFVHRTTDGGRSWRIISPDLTTNDPAKQRQFESGGLTLDVTAAENHTTILTIAPSPVQDGVIWAGTDDGNIQVTRDNGATWFDVTGNVEGVPAATWVPHIEPSKFTAGAAFAVFDNHRRGDFAPYIRHTTDFGRSWTALGTEGLDGFLHVIEQDPVERNLLFAGTEFGLFASFDGGQRWQKWTHGFPTVPVRGLVVHPRDHDLVIGTHGRAAWVIDDIRPLREMAARPVLASQPLHLFETPVAWQHEILEAMGYRSTGDAMFFGDNRPYGALLSFWSGAGSSSAEEDGGSAVSRSMQSRMAPATIEITDEAGEVVRTIRTTASPGLNRVVWDLTGRGFRGPGQSERPMAGGPEVVPGTYAVKVTAGGAEANGSLEVVLDPRLGITPQERIANHAAIERLGAAQERAGDALAAINEIRSAIESVPSRLRDRSDGVAAAIRDTAAVLVSELNGFEERFTGPRDVQGIASSDGTVFEALGGARAVGSSFHAPGPAQRLRIEQAETLLSEVVAELDTFLNDRYESFRRLARSAEVELLPAPPRIRG
jgi:photosystem II stability/assembly factor-like uncharacterized protein